MPQYETVVILPPEHGPRGVKEIESKLGEVIKKFQGSIKTIEDWGTRRLTYPMKKSHKGQFVYVNYTANSDNQTELSRIFNIDENIWRYANIRLEDDYDYLKAKQSFLPENSDDFRGRRGGGRPFNRGGRPGGREGRDEFEDRGPMRGDRNDGADDIGDDQE